MMRQSLEGQAIEVSWIRNNTCDLVDDDYYRMCMKKSSWYTCIYPCRVGALVAEGKRETSARFDRYGCYLGAAFQIQDDLLNLTGRRSRYGKEISGDLWEGKRTLVLIEYLRTCTVRQRERLQRFWERPGRNERTRRCSGCAPNCSRQAPSRLLARGPERWPRRPTVRHSWPSTTRPTPRTSSSFSTCRFMWWNGTAESRAATFHGRSSRVRRRPNR